MFSLEIYKFIRSRAMIWMGIFLIVPLAIVFLGRLENESALYYHPLFNQNDLSWLHFKRNYNFFFIFFFPLPLIILYSLIVHMDKKAGLMKNFTTAGISKFKFWITKFLFLQILTLLYIFIYVCFPVFMYVFIYDPSALGISFFQTGLFLSVKSWLALSSITTIIFIIQIVSTSFYMGLLLPMILYIWGFILQWSPLILFVRSVFDMNDPFRENQPFVWNMNSFRWEATSLILSMILILLFATVIFIFKKQAYFKRLFFGMAAGILLLSSCQSDRSPTSNSYSISNPQKDSALVQWIDTVQILDKENSTFLLNNIIDSDQAKIIYLDFWNSHCIPCMKAFPDINALADHYNTSELKVIFLNTDENPSRWERALSFTDNLNQPGHYRVKHLDFKILAKVGLKVYPRYMVLDQNRNIIEYRAPVPYKEYVDSLLSNDIQ